MPMTAPVSRHSIFFAEMFGTFCLVFAGTGAVVVNSSTQGSISHAGVALTFGLVVMAMIYAVGNISGAHLNPAVTLAFCVARRLSVWLAPIYLAGQLIGAIFASLCVWLIFGNVASLGATLPAGSPLQSFALELILTLILMVVILCVSTGPKEAGIMAGIAVGGVIALEAMFAGPISGASMNPARSLAPALVSLHLHHLWLYLLAPTIGALLAVPVWKSLRVKQAGIQGVSS
jgi:aquaporin NIP